MSVTQTIDSHELVAFVERESREFAQAARVLKDTRTLSATNTFQAFQRVPGTELVVALSAPSPWAASQETQPVVVTFDGDMLHGDARAGGNGPRYGAGFDLRAVLLDSISARAPACRTLRRLRPHNGSSLAMSGGANWRTRSSRNWSPTGTRSKVWVRE
ncbi:MULTISPECIES: hypothetical protein [Burkholderia]|uniref:Aldolase n=1 Tax=Burkholderia aenigmatica TaxID=2015348 RepID=A0A6J5IUM2_9BURK|nr:MULTISPECIES: hypothetical protein [Burkholderia]CAB3961492.1 aldolase [Burkholderia aenigmatica]